MAAVRKSRRAPAPLETEIQQSVLEHWQKLGKPLTKVAAIPNANAHGQPGLTPGLADLLIMGPDIPGGIPIAFMELKRTRPKFGGARESLRKLTPTEEAQAQFAILCAKLGLICVTVYGRDEPIGYLERWNIVREQHYPEPPPDRRLELEWP